MGGVQGRGRGLPLPALRPVAPPTLGLCASPGCTHIPHRLWACRETAEGARRGPTGPPSGLQRGLTGGGNCRHGALQPSPTGRARGIMPEPQRTPEIIWATLVLCALVPRDGHPNQPSISLLRLV